MLAGMDAIGGFVARRIGGLVHGRGFELARLANLEHERPG
jgi:hypothetical protein